jgi:nitrite reductase/ring-hydroxylating ferredoxin subunit
MGASLAGGCLHQGTVACPWHAWQFDLKDGCWVDNPKIKVEVYPIKVVDENLVIELPD